MIWGATLLGGGGGGSLQSGLDMLESYKKAHPDKAPELELITYEDMFVLQDEIIWYNKNRLNGK